MEVADFQVLLLFLVLKVTPYNRGGDVIVFDHSPSRFRGLLVSMQASCHRKGPLIVLMTRVRGHYGRSDRCGDRGKLSAILGDTSMSGRESPEAQEKR